MASLIIGGPLLFEGRSLVFAFNVAGNQILLYQVSVRALSHMNEPRKGVIVVRPGLGSLQTNTLIMGDTNIVAFSEPYVDTEVVLEMVARDDASGTWSRGSTETLAIDGGGDRSAIAYSVVAVRVTATLGRTRSRR